MSIEHTVRPAVFGTSTPPSGLSGQIRRVAFGFSESRWSHWLLLMFADRINVIEGVLDDFWHGRVPNLLDEFGIKARWKYDRPLVRGAAAASMLAGLVVTANYLLLRRRGRRVRSR
jgi:hypothetical protein